MKTEKKNLLACYRQELDAALAESLPSHLYEAAKITITAKGSFTDIWVDFHRAMPMTVTTMFQGQLKEKQIKSFAEHAARNAIDMEERIA